MVSFCTQIACKDTIFFGHMQVLWRKLNSGMWFLTVLGRKNARFFYRSSLGHRSVEHKTKRGTRMDAFPYYYAYTRGLPSCTQHSEVALVTPLSVLLSGGEELVCLFRELFFAGKFLVYVPKLRLGSKYSEQLRSPHKLKFAGTPKRKERSNNRSFLYYNQMHNYHAVPNIRK